MHLISTALFLLQNLANIGRKLLGDFKYSEGGGEDAGERGEPFDKPWTMRYVYTIVSVPSRDHRPLSM
jgi:hypothetical protein